MAWHEAELDDLRWHWDDAYEIIYAGRTYSALRRDGMGCVTALTAGELLTLIRADYFARPVGRRSGSA